MKPEFKTLPTRLLLTALAVVVSLAACEKTPPAEPAEAGVPTSAPRTTIVKDMKLIPAGIFRMGSDRQEVEEVARSMGLRSIQPLLAEVPSRSVGVADFYIDTFLVNNQQYQEFVEAVPAWSKEQLDPSQHNGRYLEHWSRGRPPQALNLHPVTFITWHSAFAYCYWKGKRLPTEMEFEWAAQDGEARSRYPWGDAPPSDGLVNWGGDRRRSTSPVGNYPPNPRGLYDMAGNVWQFMADPWLGSYAEAEASEVTAEALAADLDFRRVVRGGSYDASAVNLRVRYRDSHRALDAREIVGFRCAKSVDAAN